MGNVMGYSFTIPRSKTARDSLSVWNRISDRSKKFSEKIHRNARKGGAPNALYLRSSIENLPEELNGIADHVFVLFPWGSLLGAILGEKRLLEQIRRICAPNARMEVVFSFEPVKDRSELERFGIESLSGEELENKLIRAYRDAGFLAQLHFPADLSGARTTWGRRLAQNNNRRFFRVSAHSFSDFPSLFSKP